MSEVENIKQKIKDIQHEINFVKTSLENTKRLYERDKDLVWENYRRKADELEGKTAEAREKMNFFENEIQQRKDKIRELENQKREEERLYTHSESEIDQLRDDDIPDNEQIYDFMQRRRDAELSSRRQDLIDNEIRRYEDEITDFSNRYYSKEADIGDYDGQQEVLRQDKRDQLYQKKIYYKDLSEADREKLRDLLHRLELLEDDLKAAYEKEHLVSPKEKYDHLSESYQPYLDDKFWSADEEKKKKNNPEDEDPGKGYSLYDFDGRPQEEFDEDAFFGKGETDRQKSKISGYHKPSRDALKNYAEDNNQPFHEIGGRQEYKASVGQTDYHYVNKNRVEIIRREDKNEKNVPSVEDFMVALAAEKDKGKSVINVSKADSDEYRARLMIACQRVGLRTRGYTKIEDVDSLDEKTCEMLRKMPNAEKNKELLERLRSRKKTTQQPDINNLHQIRKNGYGR